MTSDAPTRSGWRLPVGAAGLALLVALAGSCAETAAPEIDPATPDSLQVTAVGMRAVRVEWRELEYAAGRYTYRIERRDSLRGGFRMVADGFGVTAGATPLYLDTNVEPETYYGYRVTGISPLGLRTAPTVVRGTRTAPWPGVQVMVRTEAPTAAALDADGYVVALTGQRDTLKQRVAPNGTHHFARLLPGRFTLELRGVADNCAVDDAATRTVDVPSEGVNTVVPVTLTVNCQDRTLGTIRVEAAVTGDSIEGNGSMKAVVSGVPPGGSTPVVLRASALDAAGGSATFDNLRPASYEVALDSVAAQCTVADGLTRTVQVDSAGRDTVRFAITCPGKRRRDTSGRPYHLRNEWAPQSATAGSRVALRTYLDLTRAPGVGAGTVTVEQRYDTTLLRYDSASASPSFPSAPTVGSSEVPDQPKRRLTVLVLGLQEQPGNHLLATLHFTTRGSGQAITESVVKEIGTFSENLPLDSTVHVISDTLAIGGSGGGPPPAENQAPVARAGGPYSGAVNTPIVLDGRASSDADGTISQFRWTFSGGGVPPAAVSGATPSVTFTAAGKYTASLTVTDDDGATHTATAEVTVTGGSPPPTNQAPTANAGGPYAIAANTELTLNGSGTDPDGSITQYRWTFSGPATVAAVTGAAARVTFTVGGSYTATLTVTDNGGLTATATAEITVTGGAAPPPPGSGARLVGTFGSITQDGTRRAVELIITLDLATNLDATPGPEILASWKLDTLRWENSRLEFRGITFGSSVPGTNRSEQAPEAGWISLEGAPSSANDRGIVTLAKVRFYLRAGATGTTVTRTVVAKLQGAPSTGNYSYLNGLTVVEGSLAIP